MSFKIVRYKPSIEFHKEDNYKPALAIVNKKLYKVDSWNDLFKMLLFSFCYRNKNMERVNRDVNVEKRVLKYVPFIKSDVEESSYYLKFAPNLYVRVFSDPYYDYCGLRLIWDYIGDSKLEIYLFNYKSHNELESYESAIDAFIEDKKLNETYKSGATKYLIAHINGKVLTDREKFYRRIEREFDRKVLIGDIEISDEEEIYLHGFMKKMLNNVAFDKGTFSHPKVFAYGMVRVALKHYSSKTFWPYLKSEYGVNIPGNYQNRINDKFKFIMQEYEKLYDTNVDSVVQNVCMHSFVCNKCADQFFDYIFDFWRVDLAKSIENCIDDDGNDLFDILIDEISHGAQDIMLHSMMALQNNPTGAKNRFRRFLKMIDKSYWYDADYSDSKSRMIVLFNQWKDNPKGNFYKEIKKTASVRKNGRGEKLLTKPTIVFEPKSYSFKLVLPKQLLRNCTENEQPVWYIKNGGKVFSVVPQLLHGKAFLFTEECSIELDPSHLFETFDIQLMSEQKNYYRRYFESDEIRYFNSKFRSIDIANDYISKDLTYLFTKRNTKISCINNTTLEKYGQTDDYDFYLITPVEGSILLLPNSRALSIGKPLEEGLISDNIVRGVTAFFENNEYPVFSSLDKIFFKTTRKQLNGTAIKISKNGKPFYSGRVVDNDYIEFKIDESLDDVYGYIIDLCKYIDRDGAFNVEINIPNRSIKSYKICFINRFNYSYDGEPFIFRDTAKIEFPTYMCVRTNKDWFQNSSTKSLEFDLDEYLKNGNKYVSDQKLQLQYQLLECEVNLEFDLPVLYWKYDVDDRWYIQRPSDKTIKNLPDKIYVSGCLDFAHAKMFIKNAEDLYESEVSINYDKENQLYYFRTIDIAGFLDREKDFRSLYIKVNDKKDCFFRIACRSFVKSKSITSDYANNKIIGHFDIFGDADYVATVRYGDELIEEDIPVIDGRFEVECEIKSGIYNIQLFEVEEDDSGFGSVSYRIGDYQLHLSDVNHMSGKYFMIQRIGSYIKDVADLPLSTRYLVTDIMPIEYNRLSSVGPLYTWKYDPDDDELLSKFVYYRAVLRDFNANGEMIKICGVFLMFDNLANATEVIMFVHKDGEFEGLTYSPDRAQLCPKLNGLDLYEQRHLKMLDDDIYRIEIIVGG